MRLSRDLAAQDLIKALKTLGYEPTRQSGSHIRLATTEKGTHHITVPNHDPLRLGTLNAILNDVAEHHGLSRNELLLLLRI